MTEKCSRRGTAPATQKFRCAVFLVALAAALPYLSTLQFEFAYDDFPRVVHEPVVTAPGFSLARLEAVVMTPTFPGNLYRPLEALSFYLQVQLHGLNSTAFHAVNVMLHVLCCILVLILLRTLMPENVAFAAATLFAVHPLHVEAVANIVGRAELLVALCGLSALFVFRAALRAATPVRSAAALVGSAVLFFLATCAKESGYVLLVLVPLVSLYTRDLPRHRREVWSRAANGVVLLVVAAVSGLLLRAEVLGSAFLLSGDSTTYFPENPLFQRGWDERLMPAAVVLGTYLERLVLPVSLSADYAMTQVDFFEWVFSLRGAARICFLFGMVAAIFHARNRRWWVLGLWYFFAWALTSNVFVPIGTLMGDRLAYLPNIGAIGFFTAFSATRLRTGWVKGALLAVFLCFFLTVTLARVPVWSDNRTLFAQTVQDAPRSPKAFANYGAYLMEHGEIERAEQMFLQAHRLNPRNLRVLRYLVDIAAQTGRFALARHWCRLALALDPHNESFQEAIAALQGL